jgi:hypothetical protein
MAATVSRDLCQELRLALVFNGGASLAVWIGGFTPVVTSAGDGG